MEERRGQRFETRSPQTLEIENKFPEWCGENKTKQKLNKTSSGSQVKYLKEGQEWSTELHAADMSREMRAENESLVLA